MSRHEMRKSFSSGFESSTRPSLRLAVSTAVLIVSMMPIFVAFARNARLRCGRDGRNAAVGGRGLHGRSAEHCGGES